MPYPPLPPPHVPILRGVAFASPAYQVAGVGVALWLVTSLALVVLIEGVQASADFKGSTLLARGIGLFALWLRLLISLASMGLLGPLSKPPAIVATQS